MVNTPREQGENKSCKSRPTRQNIMKNDEKYCVPVSYFLEAIQLQKEEEKKTWKKTMTKAWML